MIDIKFKEKIQNGTMCAFVSKNIEVNVGDEFWFCQKDKIGTDYINNFQDLYIIKNTDLTHDIIAIAKAECVGVVEFGFNDKSYFVGDYALLCGIPIRPTPKHFGFSTHTECTNYYRKVLRKDLTGYLHIFKLVECE